MSPAAATVLLLDAVPDGSRLEQALGAQRGFQVRTLLSARAETWARSVTDDVLRPQAGESLSAVASRAFAAGGGPLLIARPELAVWRPLHGQSALSDLADGCGVAIGPMFDGGFYLVGLAEPRPELLELRHGPDALNQAFAAAHAAGIEVGLLRTERGLRSTADVAAAVADPLLDEELRAILS